MVYYKVGILLHVLLVYNKSSVLLHVLLMNNKVGVLLHVLLVYNTLDVLLYDQQLRIAACGRYLITNTVYQDAAVGQSIIGPVAVSSPPTEGGYLSTKRKSAAVGRRSFHDFRSLNPNRRATAILSLNFT